MTRECRAFGDERGFTLPELTIVIAIMGILSAIAIPSWFGIVEGRTVDSATNQVAADLRLAHTAATNRLGVARVIFRSNGAQVDCAPNASQPLLASYCLTRPVTNADGTTGTEITPRYLPPDGGPAAQRTQLTSPNILPDPTGGTIPLGVVPGATSTIEFKSDGSAVTLGATGTVGGVPNDCPTGTPSGSSLRVVSADGSPNHCVTFNTVTSKVEID